MGKPVQHKEKKVESRLLDTHFFCYSLNKPLPSGISMANFNLIENGELRMENNSTHSGFFCGNSGYVCKNNYQPVAVQSLRLVSQFSILNSQLNNEVSNAPIISTAQHSTAQHSTAQHSTAQHSTAQLMKAKL
jgi:hypothetical protein